MSAEHSVGDNDSKSSQTFRVESVFKQRVFGMIRNETEVEDNKC